MLQHLDDEASARGLNYVLNVVRPTHPDRHRVAAWLEHHGFAAAEDGRLRKQVVNRARDIGQHQDGRPGTGRADAPDGERRARYTSERERAAARPHVSDDGGSREPMGPGQEESGGYVDVEQHRF